VDLGLEEVLDAVSDQPQLGLWLDWKNASRQNIGAAVSVLIRLDTRFGLRRRVIIETGSEAVFPEARRINEAGFEHGYYLPTQVVLSAMRGGDEQETRAVESRIRQAVEVIGASAITFDWRLSSFVRANLGSWIEEQDLNRYTWDLEVDLANDSEDGRLVAERVESGDVDVILVPFKSVFWQ
jgi:hypothetical protein